MGAKIYTISIFLVPIILFILVGGDNMKLKFYEVDSEYIEYLRKYGDDKIPKVDYKRHKKFFCGIVLTINQFNYFAPVSSYNKKMHTSFLIMDKDKNSQELKPISSLRFSFMFPCPIEYLSQKDFSKEDTKYQNLLRKELDYCNKNKNKIIKTANEVYKLGLSENSRSKFNICDFKTLEQKSLEYINTSK